MSYRVTTWVLEHVTDVTSTEKLILWALGDRANDDGSGAWPSNESLARFACTHKRTIQRSLRSLEADGRIVNEGTHRSGTTIWRVVVPWSDPEKGWQFVTPTEKEGVAQRHGGGGTAPPEPTHEPTLKVSSNEETPDVDLFGQPSTNGKPDPTQAIFDHWVKAMGKDPARTRLTDKRRSKIKARLKHFTPADLIAAIDACRASKFHMGANDNRTLYNDLAENILPSDDKVEWWLEQGSVRGGGSVKRDRHRLGGMQIDEDAVFGRGQVQNGGLRP